jgi:hypothetical protein
MKLPDALRIWSANGWKRLLRISLRPSLAAQDGPFREIIAFHCEQAAVKYLKAFLASHQIEFPKTHDICRIMLADEMPEWAPDLRSHWAAPPAALCSMSTTWT